MIVKGRPRTAKLLATGPRIYVQRMMRPTMSAGYQWGSAAIALLDSAVGHMKAAIQFGSRHQ